MTLIKGGENMPNIKPISDLRNYSAVLEDVTVGSPVYLTKNGHGCYTIMDINEQEEMSRKARKYDKMVAELEVMKMLNEGLASANEEGWIDEDSMTIHFNDKFKVNKRECSSKLQKELVMIFGEEKMTIKELGEIIKFCKENNEPVYLEFNDKENLIIMSSETYDRREKMLELYEQLVYIESERIINNKQYTIDELSKYLDNVIKDMTVKKIRKRNSRLK